MYMQYFANVSAAALRGEAAKESPDRPRTLGTRLRDIDDSVYKTCDTDLGAPGPTASGAYLLLVYSTHLMCPHCMQYWLRCEYRCIQECWQCTQISCGFSDCCCFEANAAHCPACSKAQIWTTFIAISMPRPLSSLDLP